MFDSDPVCWSLCTGKKQRNSNQRKNLNHNIYMWRPYTGTYVNFTEIKGKFFRKLSSDRNVQGDHYMQGCYIQVWLYLADRTSHLFYNLASVTLSVCCQKFNEKSATFSLASSTFSTDDNCLLLFSSQHGLVCSISKSIDVAEKSCGKDTLNVLKDVTNWVRWTLC